jgi:hypothetical protein
MPAPNSIIDKNNIYINFNKWEKYHIVCFLNIVDWDVFGMCFLLLGI